jgi:hypothetical protein
MTAPSPDEAQLDIIFYYGAYPLWQFLQQALGIDIRDVCSRVAVEEPKLITPAGIYRMRIVDNDYTNDFPQRDADHDSHLTFLLNCVNVVFNMLKEGIIRDGVHILRPYSFQLDSSKSLELVWDDEYYNPDEICIEYAYNCPQLLDDSIKLGVVFEATGEPDLHL